MNIVVSILYMGDHNREKPSHSSKLTKLIGDTQTQALQLRVHSFSTTSHYLSITKKA